MGKSKISWTDDTWNPVIGCQRVSPACDRCYAITMANRQPGMARGRGETSSPYDGLTERRSGRTDWVGKAKCLPERLGEPLSWKKPRRIFVCSMSDLFHGDVPNEFVAAVFGVMAACPQHTFIVLTKRPERMKAWFEWVVAENVLDSPAGFCMFRASDHLDEDYEGPKLGPDPTGPRCPTWPLPNVILGASIWDQPSAERNIRFLLDTPAHRRFVSYEPALGPVDFTPFLPEIGKAVECVVCHMRKKPIGRDAPAASGNSYCCYECPGYDKEPFVTDLWPGESRESRRWPEDEPYPRLSFIVSGGETGPGARPAHPQWFRDVRDQCKAARVAYAHKQNGIWIERRWNDGPFDATAKSGRDVIVDSDGSLHKSLFTAGPGRVAMSRVTKKKAGRLLDGQLHDEFPEMETP